MTEQARGIFTNIAHDILPLEDPEARPSQSRIRVRRTYSGGLVGESVGELLVCRQSDDLFGYVGMDRFDGRIGDRRGSFIFQHGELHGRAAGPRFGYIVAGSGTADLRGIEGSVAISVSEAGEHSVVIDYSLAPPGG